MTDPFKELVSLLDVRMKKHTGRAVSGVPCELGTITATGLKLDSFKHEIQDYLVTDMTLIGTYINPVDDTGIPEPGAVTSPLTKFDIRLLLRPGDRVMVEPVNGGQDFVVVAKVVPNG